MLLAVLFLSRHILQRMVNPLGIFSGGIGTIGNRQVGQVF